MLKQSKVSYGLKAGWGNRGEGGCKMALGALSKNIGREANRYF